MLHFGCDTVAQYHGVGKTSMVKKLRMGKQLKLLINNETWIDQVINEAATLISSCYGFGVNNMTNWRINSWCQKTSKTRKSAPLLRTLPSTRKTFRESVKHAHFAHFQVTTWHCKKNEISY